MDGQTPSSSPPRGDGILPHIYVLDADPAFLEVAGDLLSEAGVRVTLEPIEGAAEEMLAGLRATEPDLLVLDVVPQRNDAAYLLTGMQADPALAKVPVLLTSTNPTIALSLATAHTALVRDLIAKPFDMDEFLAKLSHLLGRD